MYFINGLSQVCIDYITLQIKLELRTLSKKGLGIFEALFQGLGINYFLLCYKLHKTARNRVPLNYILKVSHMASDLSSSLSITIIEGLKLKQKDSPG